MKRIKIVVLDGNEFFKQEGFSALLPSCDVTVFYETKQEDVNRRMEDCDAVVVNKVKIGQKEIDASPRLKLIAESATGTDNIDVRYAESKGVAVRNVKGYSTDSVIQVTWMHILNLVTHGVSFNSFVHSGIYSRSGFFSDSSHPFFELRDKKLGIIGMGAIGKGVARIASAFGMQVSYYPTSGIAHSADYPSVSFEKLLVESDVISIHAPLNERTRNLIGKKELALMKPAAFLVNMGRGAIVDEKALVEALNGGMIAGAATDVYVSEPITSSHPYLSELKNPDKLMLTPHIGWCSNESVRRLQEQVAENICKYFSMQP